MRETIDVAEARRRSELRLVLPPVPGPWAEGAKGLFHVKGVPFVRVRQRPGEANEELVAWTGESNAPQAIWQNEPARSGWAQIVHLAERLAPEPPLLPSDPEQRALLFGLLHAICGEEGFGWQRRLTMFREVFSIPLDVLPGSHPVRAMVERMSRRYGYSERAAQAAPRRAAAILRMLSARLEAQRAAGSPYFLGNALTALDVYWATFAALLAPLPPELCEMPDAMRSQYTAGEPEVLEAAAPALLEHRDFVYERHLELPLDL